MSSKPATTTQTKSPLGGPQGNLFGDIWGQAPGAVSGAINTPIPQQTVAPATPAQYQGAQEMLNVAPTLGANAPGISNLTGQIASGYFSNPWNNPNFQGAASAALDPSIQALQRSVLPRVQDTSLRGGGVGTGPAAYGGVGGGSPQDILTQNVLNDWSRNALNTTAGMANTAYGQGLGLIPQIPGLQAAATTGALTPAAATEQAGGIQQQLAQPGITNLLDYYRMLTGNPLSFLQQGASIGSTGGFGTTTGVSAAPALSTQYLQGGLGVLSGLGSFFGGKAGMPNITGGGGGSPITGSGGSPDLSWLNPYGANPFNLGPTSGSYSGVGGWQ